MSVSFLRLYRSLGPVDARNVRRDPLLAWVGLLPFVLAVAYRLFVPWLREVLLRSVGFDLLPYYPLMASAFVTAAPGVVGMVVGFLLLDERDEGVLAAIAVTPVKPLTYLAYRVSMPLLAAVLTTLMAYPIMGLVPLAIGDLFAVAAVAALLAPWTALFLAAFAENKVSGFAMAKVLNVLNITPVAAWFIALPWQWLAGIVPAYWPMKMLWLAAEGRPYANYTVAGVVAGAVWIALLQRYLFRRPSHRSHA